MRLLTLLTIGALSAAGPTLARDWAYEATLYGWLPAMNVSVVDTRFGEVESSGSSSDARSRSMPMNVSNSQELIGCSTPIGSAG